MACEIFQALEGRDSSGEDQLFPSIVYRPRSGGLELKEDLPNVKGVDSDGNLCFLVTSLSDAFFCNLGPQQLTDRQTDREPLHM